MTDRRVWLARLPEMRLAYFETKVEPGEAAAGGVIPAFGQLWDEFNEWRVHTRPSLGRIDIAAIGWALQPAHDGTLTYRTCVPIRSDYDPPNPARTTFFPGGSFAYAYADNVDEIDDAAQAVHRWIAQNKFTAKSGIIEVYKFHYNLEQHPCDCGLLVLDESGRDPIPAGGSHASPLPIAR